MKRRKLPDPRPGWARNWANRPDSGPEWARNGDRMPIPAPGTPAPSGDGGIDFGGLNERAARREWEHAHITWLNANGLAYSEADLDAWWARPDRDQVPMPGVLQWQQRISGYRSGAYGSYGGSGQPLDASAAQHIQALQQEITALQQARQSDAARLAWYENALTRAAYEIADTNAQRDELTAYIDRQNQRENEQAAAIAEQRKDAARLKEQVTERDAVNGRLKETAAQLETANRNLRYDVQAKAAAIAQLETAARTALPPADTGIERALRSHEEVAAWHAVLIRELKDEVSKLRRQVAWLRDRNDRRADETDEDPEDAPASPAAASLAIESRGATGKQRKATG